MVEVRCSNCIHYRVPIDAGPCSSCYMLSEAIKFEPVLSHDDFIALRVWKARDTKEAGNE